MFTIEDCKAALADIQRRFPDNVNPLDAEGTACLYSTADPADDSHCIVGQLAAEQGWTVPPPDCTINADGAATWYDWPVTGDAAIYLSTVQICADNVSTQTCQANPIPWKDIEL